MRSKQMFHRVSVCTLFLMDLRLKQIPYHAQILGYLRTDRNGEAVQQRVWRGRRMRSKTAVALTLRKQPNGNFPVSTNLLLH